MTGPLDGLRVVELAGIGPAPFCSMLLADLGADVIRVDRIGYTGDFISPEFDLLNRGKRSIAIDLKSDVGLQVALRLIDWAEVLVEGFRPGTTERLGIGPAICLAHNPGLVYTRVTGWGQDGPMAAMAGHDIDYIALSGVLNAIGPEDQPVVPLNLVGDFGGGGMLAVVGVLAAVIFARATGKGQVVDAAMVDGSALLMAAHHGYIASGWWTDQRESNLLDGGAPFYSVYETSDNRHVAVGAIEPEFFSALLDGLEIDQSRFPAQYDRSTWEAMRTEFEQVFAKRPRDEWAERFDGTDACVAPVLTTLEARNHPHIVHRQTFVDVDGVAHPAPAPRFSKTSTSVGAAPSAPGDGTDEVMELLGYNPGQIGKLRGAGAIA